MLNRSNQALSALLPPTRIRFLIVAVATLVSFVLYLHRFCLSFAERSIKDDLELSEEQVGLLLSAFFWSYALAQVPSGWLGDRLGIRHILALYVLLWSLLTGLIGGALVFLMVLTLRLGCGLAQAGAYPTSASLLGKWIPLAHRGLANAIVALGGRLGGAAAPVITAFLLVAFVPLSVSSLLQPGDLLDVPGLCRQLKGNENKAPSQFGRWVYEQLPSPGVRVVLNLEKGELLGPEQVDSLRRALNEVLQQRDLCRGEDIRDLPLPDEALHLVAAPRLALSTEQVERLNRLLLEAAFPDYIKKLYVHGWRPTLIFIGLGGVIVALLFWLCFRERPDQHPWCNQAEVDLIGEGLPAPPLKRLEPLGGIPFRAMLASRSLGLLSLCQFFTNVGWVFLVTWLPRYLAEVHKVPVLERGWMVAVPLFVGMGGMLAGGWVTDFLARWLGVRWGRCVPISWSRFAAAGAYLACLWLPTPWTVIGALAVVALSNDLGMPAIWAYTQDVGGRHVGSILGWGNMWGNLGAAVSPLVLNAMIQRSGWEALFLACAGAYLLAGLVALGVDARQPILASEEELAGSSRKV
jgi:sugar phosphate permease